MGSRSTTIATVAFSGAGHLLAYHLGVASVLLHRQGNAAPSAASTTSGPRMPPIRAVSGSSSGAIAAAVLSCLPRRLGEYTDRFLQDRGRAFYHFREMLLQEVAGNHEKEQQQQQQQQQQHDDENGTKGTPTQLYICATKSENGSPHLFPFIPDPIIDDSRCERLLKTIEASCHIPISFHPLDLFKKSLSYKNEGVEIDSQFYVDGGISGVFPPSLPLDILQDTSSSLPLCQRIFVCPLSIGSISPDSIHFQGIQTTHVISPSHQKTSSNRFMMMKSRDGIPFNPLNFENLQTLVVAGGVASPGTLESWHQRGVDDATHFLDEGDHNFYH